MPFEPEEKVSVELQAQQWNVVLAVLSKGPYDAVAPIIQEISKQAAALDPAGVQPVAIGAGEDANEVNIPPSIIPPKQVNGRHRARG